MSLTWLSGRTEASAAASTQAQNHLVDLAKYHLHDANTELPKTPKNTQRSWQKVVPLIKKENKQKVTNQCCRHQISMNNAEG